MDKIAIMKSVTDTHNEITEQSAVVNGFLMTFHKKGVLVDLKGIVEFFNVGMARHFVKEEVIFKALLKVKKLDPKIAEIVEVTIKEHDMFMEQFRELAQDAAQIESKEKELSMEFIKQCQYITWGLSKHAQVEDFIIFPEVAAKLSENIFKLIEDELSRI